MVSKLVDVPGFASSKELQVGKLYRYMPLEACNGMVDEGEIRISASTKFKLDDGLSHSRRDDEHNKSTRAVVSEEMKIRVAEGLKLTVTPIDERADGTLTKFHSQTISSYWILSLSTDLTVCLFDEFGEDAAVEVFHPDEFLRRLQNASERLLVPIEPIRHDHVKYADEYLAYGYTALLLDPLFHKAEKYRCHKEYRVVWHPRRGEDEHEFLHLGSLKDIARVVRKEQVMDEFREAVIFPDYAIEEYLRFNKPSREDRRRAERMQRLGQDLNPGGHDQTASDPTSRKM